ncbi:MAG: GIY-YIG nuclease family protein [Candidatus Vogelbacteria bacterium]|nr:GIY-YIG nuclease family protein [Candidatus Vogelbacteria bacterium]
MFYVYILQSKSDGGWYTGYTPDLRERILAHNAGKVRSTKSRVPLSLLYYEACHNLHDARARERYLKTGMGKRYLKQRLKFFLKNGASNGL